MRAYLSDDLTPQARADKEDQGRGGDLEITILNPPPAQLTVKKPWWRFC